MSWHERVAANDVLSSVTAAGVRAERPDLNPIVFRIEAASKTADEGAVLDQHLATVKDPAEQARQDALLRPLTEFGDKTPKGAETSRTPGPKGVDNVQPPGPRGGGPRGFAHVDERLFDDGAKQGAYSDDFGSRYGAGARWAHS